MRRRANRRDYLSLLTLFGANNILLGSDCGRDSERQPKATHPNPLTTNSQRELVRIGNQSGLACPVIGEFSLNNVPAKRLNSSSRGTFANCWRLLRATFREGERNYLC